MPTTTYSCLCHQFQYKGWAQGAGRQPSRRGKCTITMEVVRKRYEAQTDRGSTARSLKCTTPVPEYGPVAMQHRAHLPTQSVCYKIPMWLNLLCLQCEFFLSVATAPLTFYSHKMRLHLMTHLYANRLLQSNVHV